MKQRPRFKMMGRGHFNRPGSKGIRIMIRFILLKNEYAIADGKRISPDGSSVIMFIEQTNRTFAEHISFNMPVNFEFKAKHPAIAEAEELLLQHKPLFMGEDHQVDTYFKVANGRLKLREGTIEQALIFYERTNTASAKQSNVLLHPNNPGTALKEMLVQSLGIKTVVDKKRRIYFIDNVKFHFDTVEGLGQFIEVEAIDKDGSLSLQKIEQQCRHYQELFNIKDADLIAESYSDLLLAKKSSLF